jgi:hypothetical protein
MGWREAGRKILLGVSRFSRVLRAYWVHGGFARKSGIGSRVAPGEKRHTMIWTIGVKGNSMPAKEELLKKDGAIKDQAATAELENKTEELKPDEAEKIAGGFNPIDGHH